MAMTSASDPNSIDPPIPEPRHPEARRASRRRFWAMIGAAVLAFSAIGWSIGWVLLSIHLRASIDGWMDFRRAMGDRLTHGDQVLDGFPLAIRFTYADVDWRRADGPRILTASTDQLVVSAVPWAPLVLRLASDRPVTLSWTAPSLTVAITASSGDGALTLAPGQLDHVRFALHDAVAVDREHRVIARAARLAVDADPTPTAGTDDIGLAPTLLLSVSADSLEPTDILTPHIPFEGPADGRLRAVVRGPLPISLDPAALALWRDSGGVVDVDHLGLNWRPLDLTADGTVTLDGLLRPEGAAQAEIRGLPAMIDRVEDQGLIKRDVAALLRLATAAFSRTGGGAGGPSVQAPVTLQDGILSLGPFKILRVPSLVR